MVLEHEPSSFGTMTRAAMLRRQMHSDLAASMNDNSLQHSLFAFKNTD